MRFTFLTFLSIITFCCYSQTTSLDTMSLSNGTIILGKFVGEGITDYSFILGDAKKITSYPKNEVKRIVKGDGKVYWDINDKNTLIEQTAKNEGSDYTITNENLLQRFKELNERTRQSGIYSEQAGKWGIASCVFTLSGVAMSLAGIFTKTPEVAYVGGGLGGTGLVLLIPTFVKLKKSGKVLSDRNSK